MEVDEIIKIVLIANGISIVLAICWVISLFWGMSDLNQLHSRSRNHGYDISGLRSRIEKLENRLSVLNRESV